MKNLLRVILSGELDEITLKEIRLFIERKYDEQFKIKGEIARDLSRIGINAFQDTAAYEALRRKYRARWTATKKLAILNKMQREWCR